MRLRDNRVVVIGGSSGIGFAVARLAREEGARVCIAGRTPDRLTAAQRELGDVDAVVADTSDDDSIRRLFQGLDRVDHVMLSAGGPIRGLVVEADLGPWRTATDERLWGALHVVRHAVPRMAAGSFTFTSGSLADRPLVGTSFAAALAGAIEALTRSLALELAPRRVNAISPGPIDTPMLRKIVGREPEKALAGIAAGLPARRVGSPEDVAAIVVMAMANPYLTGEVIHIDGGTRIAPS